MLIQIMLSINRGQRHDFLLGTDDFDCLAHFTLALPRALANDQERESRDQIGETSRSSICINELLLSSKE